jgi:hypothetical protein
MAFGQSNSGASGVTGDGTDITLSPAAAGSVIIQQAASPTDDALKVLTSGASQLFGITSAGVLRGDTANQKLILSSGSGTFLHYDANNYVGVGSSATTINASGGYILTYSSSGLRSNGSASLGVSGSAWGLKYMIEVSAPSAPAANEGVMYLEDNGSGKTKLMILFATGAAQQIAIQP